MSEPRTTREALIAQMLGELDVLLSRAEKLPDAIAEAEKRVAVSVQVLSEAGDRYRLAVTAFTEEAKLTLTDFVRYKAGESVASTVDEQRVRIQEAVEAAYRCRVSQHGAQHDSGGQHSAEKCRCSRVNQRLELALIAALTSMLTATLVLLIVRMT